MNWEEMKNIVEQCVPEQLLKEYTICVEISCANTNETRIEIDNSNCEIFVKES